MQTIGLNIAMAKIIRDADKFVVYSVSRVVRRRLRRSKNQEADKQRISS